MGAFILGRIRYKVNKIQKTDKDHLPQREVFLWLEKEYMLDKYQQTGYDAEAFRSPKPGIFTARQEITPILRPNFKDRQQAKPLGRQRDNENEQMIEQTFRSEGGVRVMVPIKILSGTQNGEAYSQSRRRYVENQMRTNGVQFLQENPIQACFIPSDGDQNGNQFGRLAILEGHHRARYAPKYGISKVPTAIFTLEQTARVLNKIGETFNGDPFTPETAKDWLDFGIIKAEYDFTTYPDNLAAQRRLTGVASINELVDSYKLTPIEQPHHFHPAANYTAIGTHAYYDYAAGDK